LTWDIKNVSWSLYHQGQQRDHSKIYQTVIVKEREGAYLGKTVQVIPHITDEIKRRMLLLGKPQIRYVITEIGGNVGDIESLPLWKPYASSMGASRRRLRCHTPYLVPYLAAAKELKTKPSQHS
jgi:CTP synthase